MVVDICTVLYFEVVKEIPFGGTTRTLTSYEEWLKVKDFSDSTTSFLMKEA